MLRNFNKKIRRSLQAGFTLLEMLMVLIIFGIITTIVVWNYGAFNNQIILTNTAYEVAMQIREAQVYSFGVRGNNDNFEGNYGVYFYLEGDVGRPVGEFKSFIDGKSPLTKDMYCQERRGGNVQFCTCDPGISETECLSKFSLGKSIKIYKIIGYQGPNAQTENYLASYITFQRPNPDAKINLVYKSGGYLDHNSEDDGITKTEIVLKSPDNQYRSIIINKNGYISVAEYKP